MARRKKTDSYRLVSTHSHDLTGGRIVYPGEVIEFEDGPDEHAETLIADGVLVLDGSDATKLIDAGATAPDEAEAEAPAGEADADPEGGSGEADTVEPVTTPGTDDSEASA